jgi:hypothetical protein
MGRDRTTNVQALSAATAQGSSETFQFRGANLMFTADGTVSTSTGSASIIIEGHCGGGVWHTIDTLALTLGVTATVDFGVTTAPWTYVRARVSAISGTNASVNVWFAVEV